MANERRLIDANAVDYENIMCSQSQLHWLNAIIERQPTVDAVEVRCKDCKHYEGNICNFHSEWPDQYHVILHFGGYPVVNAWGSAVGKTVFLTREEAEAALNRETS